MVSRRVALVVSDAVLLWLLHPQAIEAWRRLAAPRAWLAHDGADRAMAVLAAAGLWCVAAWVGLGLFAAVGARLPGAVGRGAGRFADVALPAVLRRVVVGSAGLNFVLTPITAAAAAADVPDGPGGRPVAVALSGANGAPLPGPVWPGSGDTPSPSATPTTDEPAPAATAPRTPPAPTRPAPRVPAPPSEQRMTVRADDSLWLLGARHLGARATDADVAAYLPVLYRANRDVIGDDPDLIRPGQRLTLPAPDSAARVPGGNLP